MKAAKPKPKPVIRRNRMLADIETEMGNALRSERENYFEIGALLIEAKAKLKHGEWLPWLKKNFGKSESSARNYMAAAEWRDKNPTVADLKLKPGLIYRLAADTDYETRTYPVGALFTKDMIKKIRDEVFKLAKTQWVDTQDYDKICMRFAEEKHGNSAKDRKARAEQNKPEPKPPPRVSAPQLVPTMTTKERERENLKKSRQGNLRGAVHALLTLILHRADLVGASIETEKLLEAANFLTALAMARVLRPEAVGPTGAAVVTDHSGSPQGKAAHLFQFSAAAK